MSDLAGLADATLSWGRSAALNVKLRSRVTVWRKTGQSAQSGSTGREEPIWDDVHTDLPFGLDGSGTSDGGSHEVTVGGVTYEQATAVGKFPATLVDLRAGDYIEVTDGEWAGSVFTVVAATEADQKTARRVPIAGAKAQAGWDET